MWGGHLHGTGAYADQINVQIVLNQATIGCPVHLRNPQPLKSSNEDASGTWMGVVIRKQEVGCILPSQQNDYWLNNISLAWQACTINIWLSETIFVTLGWMLDVCCMWRHWLQIIERCFRCWRRLMRGRCSRFGLQASVVSPYTGIKAVRVSRDIGMSVTPCLTQLLIIKAGMVLQQYGLPILLRGKAIVTWWMGTSEHCPTPDRWLSS